MLVVLTPYEAENFFPPPLLAELRALAPDFRPLDPTGLSPADFARELAPAGHDPRLFADPLSYFTELT